MANIEVELPDGTIAEFPEGTSRDTMRAALQRKFPMQDAGAAAPASSSGPWQKYQNTNAQPTTTLNIGGKRVTVSDDFLKLSPEQQNATVDEIAGEMAPSSSAGPWQKYQGSAQPSRGARQFQITAPDGKKYHVTGDNEQGAVAALKKHLANPKVDPATNQPPGVPAFVPPGVEAYDQQTGEVAPPQNTMADKAGAFSTGGLQGVPIIGPYLDKGSSAVAAALAMPFTGKSFGELYDQGNQYSEDVRRENPHTATAGGVVGSTAALIPAIAAAPAAFGAGEGPLAVRSAYSALTGAGINGADAAVRSGGDLEETRNGALLGAATGALAPSVASLLGAGYRATANFLSSRGASRIADLTPAVVGQLSKAMQADGIPASEIQQRLAQLGPEATLADLGPNLQQTAAGLVAKPGQARSIVQNAMREREAGANARILQALDSTIGPAPVPSQIEAGIAASQNDVAQGYGAIFQNARAVNTQGIADDLDSATANLRGPAQSAVQRVRRFLDIPGTTELDPHPQALFQTRQAIDGLLSTEDNPQVIRQLTMVRQDVDRALADAVPGIKDVDAQFAELARQRSAVGQGQTVLDSGRTAPRPQELAQQMQEGALPQGAQIGPSAVPLRLRQGARAEIDRIVGNNANDRVALQRIVKGEGDWNPQKLATLFGPDRARRIIDVLDAEKTFADTNSFVTRNSATAARMEATRALNGDQGQGFGVREGYMAGGAFGAARSAGVRAAERILGALKGASTETNHTALARGLVSNGQSRIAEALVRGARSGGPSPQALALAKALMMGGSGVSLLAPAGSAVAALINGTGGR